MIYENKDCCKRVNLDLTEKDWCSYTGECLRQLNVTNGLCEHCRYKTPLDIPKMIREYIDECR